MGEDIGVYGGTHLVTDGLLDRFGPKRVIDTPIAEGGFTGAAIGMAMMGMRPIVEMMTWNFSFQAADQIIQNAAKLRYFSGGQARVPLVIRGPNGGGVQLSAQHTHSLEGFYGHFPGLKVVSPVTPDDAKGMMLTAIRDPEPGHLPRGGRALRHQRRGAGGRGTRSPFGKARIAREGDGRHPGRLRAAGEHAAAGGGPAGRGRHLGRGDRPALDPPVRRARRIVESVKKTHRAVVVQEQWRWFSVASEVAAIIQEQAFDDLDAPVERVSGAEVPAPYARNLELAAFPSEQQVIDAVHRVARIERDNRCRTSSCPRWATPWKRAPSSAG